MTWSAITSNPTVVGKSVGEVFGSKELGDIVGEIVGPEVVGDMVGDSDMVGDNVGPDGRGRVCQGGRWIRGAG